MRLPPWSASGSGPSVGNVRQLRQHRGLISRNRLPISIRGVPGGSPGRLISATITGLRNGLAVADRQRSVVERRHLQRSGNELLARHCAIAVITRVEGVAADQVARVPEPGADIGEHLLQAAGMSFAVRPVPSCQAHLMRVARPVTPASGL